MIVVLYRFQSIDFLRPKNQIFRTQDMNRLGTRAKESKSIFDSALEIGLIYVIRGRIIARADGTPKRKARYHRLNQFQRIEDKIRTRIIT